jgi:hypothetical protein
MKSFKQYFIESQFPKTHPSNWEAVVKNRKFNKEKAIQIAKEDGAQVTLDGFIVLYHGTKHMKQIVKSGMLKQNTYLTSDYEIAKQFAHANQSKGIPEVNTFVIDAQALIPSGNKYYSLNEPVYYDDGKYIVEP